MSTTPKFEGNPKRRPKSPHPDSPTKVEPYLASEELKQAVNLAIYLRRPLLLEGEAGCGKTRLAIALAYELGLPFYRWDVRSTSKAQEGLYEYDAILRLHDVEMSKLKKAIPRDPSNADLYVKPGALGKAFQLSDHRAVVLIDEVDKADVDFPNDLLTVLEEPRRFVILETGKEVIATHAPIIIITSNKEKGSLPAPFLRRCLYYYVEFPNTTKELEDIVKAHYAASAETAPSKPLMDAAIARFLNIRANPGVRKQPGTSEFLDWLKALTDFSNPAFDANQLAENQPLPYRELLFKLQSDWKKFGGVSP